MGGKRKGGEREGEEDIRREEGDRKIKREEGDGDRWGAE